MDTGAGHWQRRLTPRKRGSDTTATRTRRGREYGALERKNSDQIDTPCAGLGATGCCWVRCGAQDAAVRCVCGAVRSLPCRIERARRQRRQTSAHPPMSLWCSSAQAPAKISADGLAVESGPLQTPQGLPGSLPGPSSRHPSSLSHLIVLHRRMGESSLSEQTGKRGS